MFLDSSKVKVIETNLNKDKKGPLVGSTGYIIPHVETFDYIIQDIHEFLGQPNHKMQKPFCYTDSQKKNITVGTYKTNNFIYIFRPVEVFFTRFGKEQQTRCERKPVINVFPFPRNDKYIEEGLPKSYFSQKIIEELPGYALDFFSDHKKIDKNPALCILVPYYTDTLVDLTMDEKEYKAWCLSVLQNRLLNLYVTTSGNNNFFQSHPAYAMIKANIHKKGRAPSMESLESSLNYDKQAVVCLLRKLLISMVNNYDIQANRLLRENNWPHQFTDLPFESKVEMLGSQVWKIGFSSNRNIMPIKNGSTKKAANRLASVQQDLLMKSGDI